MGGVAYGVSSNTSDRDVYGFCIPPKCEIEQILVEGELGLERNREQLKSIRRGEWLLAQLEVWSAAKERSLEELYARSPLPHRPDQITIRALLLECLEAHYGSLAGAVQQTDVHGIISELEALVWKYRR